MTRKVTYLGETYDCRDGESVLDALIRQGVDVPFSCRKGTCTVCMRRCVAGTPPLAAQKRLKRELAKLGYFLPCLCHPTEDLVIEPPLPADLYCRAFVVDKQPLSDAVCRVLLEPERNLEYRAGQFVSVRRADGLVRSYSLASVCGLQSHIEIHVQRVPGGRMSGWIHDELAVGDDVDVQGPNGESCFQRSSPRGSLVLIGSGTGLAPLYGIARDALEERYAGHVYLHHAGPTPESLYLREELENLDAAVANFHYRALVLPDAGPAARGDALWRAVLHDGADLRDCHIHVAGPPALIDRVTALAAAAGVASADVFADAFDGLEPGGSSEQPQPDAGGDAVPYLSPDPELWSGLDDGKLLMRILRRFYDRVYEDELLLPYFRNVTKERVIEKVYSFLRQIFTGEPLYFGDRPRNAHHWMVIDDELFDYRERLLEECMRHFGLPDRLIERWQRVEESFRRDIVKDRPWPRVVGGVEVPVEGFGETTLEYATLCDGCGAEVPAGTSVRYHLRLGEVYCQPCSRGAAEGVRAPADAPA